MTREIKFKAFEKNLKEIIPVDSIDFRQQMINTDGAWRTFDEVELIEYSGVNDIQGIEIYEKDILKCPSNFSWLVEFDERGCFIAHDPNEKLYCVLLDDYDFEIIGNAFKNPELLQDD